GSLLEFYNVALAEGPWPQKAYDDALLRDLTKRRAHTNFIINDTVIGRPEAISSTLAAKPQGDLLTPPPVPAEAGQPAEVVPAPVDRFPMTNNPLRSASPKAETATLPAGRAAARENSPPILTAPILQASEPPS